MKLETLDIIWNAIHSYSNRFIKDSGDVFYFDAKAKDKFSQKFFELYDNFKNKHMSSAEEAILDRHKVAAIFIIAILNIKPIKVPDKIQLARENSCIYNGYNPKFFGNEKLAIQMALAILREYIYIDIKKEIITVRSLDIKFSYPEITESHGNYIENYCRELYINTVEDKLSILSIAHELFWLERFNKEYVL